MQISELNQFIDQYQRDLTRVEGDLEIELLDIGDIDANILLKQQELLQQQKLEQELLEVEQGLDDRLKVAKDKLDSESKSYQRVQESYQKCAVELATSRQKHELILEQYGQLLQRLEQGNKQVIERENDLSTLDERIATKEEEMSKAKDLVKDLGYTLQQQGEQLELKKAAKGALQETIEELDRKAKAFNKSAESLRNDQYQIDIALNRVANQIDSGLKRLLQNFALTFEEAKLQR